MSFLNLKTRLNLLFIVPVMVVSTANGLILYFTGLDRLLMLNLSVLLVVLVYSRVFINKLQNKLFSDLLEVKKNVDTIRYTGELLSSEIPEVAIKGNQIEEWIMDMKRLHHHGPETTSRFKELLLQCLQEAEKLGPSGKGNLLIAKELAKLCSDIAQNEREEEAKAKALMNKLTDARERNLDLEKPLMITDGLIKTAERTHSLISKYGKKPKVHTPSPNQDPFENSVLRKIIKRAEKKEAA